MRLKTCNPSVVLALSLFAGGVSAQSISGGIPVHCDNCEVATKNGAISVGEQIKAQTKGLEEAMNYMLRSLLHGAGNLESISKDTQERIREERVHGENSLPVDSCGVYASTTARAQSSGARKVVRDSLDRSSINHTRQSRALPEGEPRSAYSVTQVINELDDEEVMVAQAIFDEKEGIPKEEVEERKRLQNIVAVPFPVATPSDEEIERIKLTGTPAERQQLAASIAVQRRQEVAQYALDRLLEDNVKTIDPQGMEELIANGLSDSFEPGELLSKNQLSALLKTYRVNSPAWYEDVAASDSEMHLLRDQSMMQAEMLSSLWEIQELLRTQLRLSSFDSVRDTSQAGPMLR